MRKFLLIICAVALLIAGCGGTNDRISKLVVGLDDEFAPMGFRDEQGMIVGFDVDLAKEAARRISLKWFQADLLKP